VAERIALEQVDQRGRNVASRVLRSCVRHGTEA
jgi:hypothetical protein